MENLEAHQTPSSPDAAPPATNLTEVLPTRRIAFGKQLDILRTYAAIGSSGQTVGNQELADVVGLSPQTTSLANGFLLACGLISRADRGYVPAPEVVRFQRAYQWSPDTAAHELAPILENTWFAQALQPHLALGPITDAKATKILGQLANATKHRAAELRLLMDYLEATGLIERHDGNIRAASPENSNVPKVEPSSASTPTPRPEPVPMRGGGLPLLVQGLLEQLPQDRTWTRAKADKWLQMAKMTFEVVYDLGPDESSFQPSDRGDQE